MSEEAYYTAWTLNDWIEKLKEFDPPVFQYYTEEFVGDLYDYAFAIATKRDDLGLFRYLKSLTDYPFDPELMLLQIAFDRCKQIASEYLADYTLSNLIRINFYREVDMFWTVQLFLKLRNQNCQNKLQE